MAIEVNTDHLNPYRENIGQVDGDEWIYRIEPTDTYIVECVVTSAGTATLKGETDTVAPTTFDNFSSAYDGTQTTTFSREVRGWSYVGLDIASGTWTVRVRRVA